MPLDREKSYQLYDNVPENTWLLSRVLNTGKMNGNGSFNSTFSARSLNQTNNTEYHAYSILLHKNPH